MTRHTDDFFNEMAYALANLNRDKIDAFAKVLCEVRRIGGRVFVLGNGGSAANASHFANDFRKVLGIETYAPTDAVSELTARANDEGYHNVFVEYLKVSHLGARDVVLVLSGSGESINLRLAVRYARERKATIACIVGTHGSTVGTCSDIEIVVPTTARFMEHSETFQLAIDHCLVTHPTLRENK